MKIAVKNSDGIQSTKGGKLQFYYLVDDAYDFTANQATDITTIDNLFFFFSYLRIDYIRLRDCLKQYFIPVWDSLSPADKKTLVRYYIYPTTFTQADIDALFTAQEQKNNWETLAKISRDARANRWEVARQKISFYLTEIEGLQLYTDTKPFKDDYVDANLPHLIMWIINGAYPPLGIDYTANGFAQKSYYSVERKNVLVDCLVYGLV